MFPSGLLDSTRARFAAAYPDTCDVWRNKGDVTTHGGQVDDWRRAYYQSPGRLTGASPSENVTGGALVEDAGFVWHCSPSVDIRPSDQLVIGGRTYDVIGTDAGRSEAIVLHVDLALVAGEDTHQ